MFCMACLLSTAFASEGMETCELPRTYPLTDVQRQQIATCLNWIEEEGGFCLGHYGYENIVPLLDPNLIQIDANEVSFYKNQRSELTGHVEVRRQDQTLQADEAYVERNPKTNEIERVHFKHHVKYLSPIGLMWAEQGVFYPQSKFVRINHVLYRIEGKRHGAALPAWGQAKEVERNKQEQIWMKDATFSHCSPLDKAWQIKARSLMLDKAANLGVARDARLEVLDVPVLYTPYLSFPVTKQRKSGFLMPIVGSTTVGGFDFAQPYYFNLAPNYDATFVPHVYGKRGLMLGGEFRYLNYASDGAFKGNFLPQDHAYAKFLNQHAAQFPSFAHDSSNRWDIQWIDSSRLFIPNLTLGFDVRQLSDDYYFQDFSTNLGRITERQILRQGTLAYTTDHWLLKSSVQSYQTLHPINETPVSDVYDRLPQLYAQGNYDELPLDGRFQLLGSFDAFRWASAIMPNPNSLRSHINPTFMIDKHASWGYFKPSIQWVGNAYQFDYPSNFLNPPPVQPSSISLPRYSVDGGLYFEREVQFLSQHITQTLEPRVYYLNVPYQNQNQITVFDSAYMIFSAEQVFRDNRFSGFDRIGDANQLGYGINSRWLDEEGFERVRWEVAQLRYFADRRVTLCYTPSGVCEDNPLTLGFLSPTADFSPVASQGIYHLNAFWSLVGDYVWDPAIHGTNNGQAGFRYQSEGNRLFNFGYSYMVNGDITQVGTSPLQDNALNQLSVAYAWPFNDHWSSMGAYSYNISKHYQMMSFLGVQYDSCCWGLRLLGGRTFRDLVQDGLAPVPRYTNSVFLQVFLKGLGSVGNNDPSSVLQTYLPGYMDTFRS